MAARRSYGTGRVYVRTDKNGRETYYGSWYVGDRRVNRRLGPKRAPGEREGLTATQAEAELRRRMTDEGAIANVGERIDVAELGRRYRLHLEAIGRKKTTTTAVESTLRVWVIPILGDRDVARVTPEDVEDLMRTMRAKLSPKSIRNHIGTLSAMYRYALHPRRRWATVNPCDSIDLPGREQHAGVIRFLTVDEVEQLVAAAVPGRHQGLDRALYLTAAMTGMRQGELIALRWQDVDWRAQKIRVRRSHVLGEFGTPKSRRSSRSVPLSDRLAGELARWQQESPHGADTALVFAELTTGEPLPRGALMRRYRRALKAAQLEPTHRFHDLRHTFGTAMAGAGVPMRTLQEWMGHEDITTTQIYADYAPNAHEAALVDAAFAIAKTDPLPQEAIRT